MIRKNRRTLAKLERSCPIGKEEIKKWQRKVSAYESRIFDYDQELLTLALYEDRFHSIVWRANYIETLGKQQKVGKNKLQRIKKDIAKEIDYDEPIEVQSACIEWTFERHWSEN